MRLPSALTLSCKRFWNKLPPSLLFIIVLFSFPAFLFQKNIEVLVGEATTFFFLALSRRGRIRLLPSVLMIVSITFFALFSPHGQVVARLGNFAITKGALESGLMRGVTLAGMVFLSQLAVAPGISLPGRAGGFIVRMFSLLDELGRESMSLQNNKKKGLSGSIQSLKRIIPALDQRLYDVYWNSCERKEDVEFLTEDSIKPEGQRKKNNPKFDLGMFLCIGVVLFFPVALYFLLFYDVI